jgi:hypothetical protein
MSGVPPRPTTRLERGDMGGASESVHWAATLDLAEPARTTGQS